MSDLSPNQNTSNGSDAACDECRELLGAYVLQALDRFDRSIVEQHLRWCDNCQAELTALQRIGTGLALGVPHFGAPSDATWAAIEARLQQDEDVEAVHAVTAPAPTRPAATTWTRWLPASIIAPLALALILLGTWNWSLQKDLNQSEAELANHTLLNSTLTTSRQVQLYNMEQSCPSCDGVGQVGVSRANSMGMVVGWDFDPLVTHDVWGIDHNGDRLQVCSLVVAQDGAVMQMFRFPDAPSRFTDIYVTDEAGNLVYTSHIVDDDNATPAISEED